MMLRVVFVNRGFGLSGRRVRPPTYWVKCGERVEYRTARTVGLYLDDRRLASLHLGGDWMVKIGRKEYWADHLYIDQLPYTLEGREWVGGDNAPALCIFCGKKVWHINDSKGRGTAWTCSVPGPPDRSYLYCNRSSCNNEHVWTCKVCHCDNLDGLPCYGCGGARCNLERTAQVIHDEEEG
jgi:hypothetical protein